MPEAARAVVVIAPNWLGDAVMALPAISDVRRAVSPGKLLVAARQPVADVFKLAPSVDEVHTLEWNGRWGSRAAFTADVHALGEVGADAALVLPNSFASAWLAKQAGIPERWGYRSDLRGGLLSRAVRRPKSGIHQGAYYQHLTGELGFASGPLEPELTVADEAIATARRRLHDRGWNGERPLIALAPGAAYGTAKRWIPAHVARLIDDLVRLRGATCVLVGSRADAATTRQIQAGLDDETRHDVIDLTGETTLEGLAAVLKLARACVSNDSGAMHLAAAIGTRVVAIFGPTRFVC